MDWYTAAGVHSRDGLAGVGQFEEFFSTSPPDVVDPGMLPTGLELEMPMPPLDMSALPPTPEPVAIDVPPSGVGVPSAAQVEQAILTAVRGGHDVASALSDLYRTVSSIGDPVPPTAGTVHTAAVSGGGMSQQTILWVGLGLLAFFALRRRG